MEPIFGATLGLIAGLVIGDIKHENVSQPNTTTNQTQMICPPKETFVYPKGVAYVVDAKGKEVKVFTLKEESIKGISGKSFKHPAPKGAVKHAHKPAKKPDHKPNHKPAKKPVAPKSVKL